MPPRKRALVRALLGLALLLAPVLAGAAGLGAGDTLGAANAAEAKGLLPPEILAFYERGEWRNRVAEWPDGRARHDEEFEKATKRNAERLALDATGGIVERASGRRPDGVLGFPFPRIDPGDPQAALKVIWNYFYGSYDVGAVKADVDLAWVGRKGLERAAGLESRVLYYDGQPEKRRPRTNPQGVLAQTIASVLYPQDLYATTVLSWRFRESDKRDLDWTYVPALRRVREVSPSNRSDGFLGSDLTQDDGGFFDGKPEDFTWKLVGETEMYRLADPWALRGDVERVALPSGGWRGTFKPGPFVGFEDPAWTGSPWAPVAAVLAVRKLWVIEAVPKDRYYLYGKIELSIDQETFQGAWNRKFSWSGELLADFVTIAAPTTAAIAPDGSKEWMAMQGSAYLAGVNLKADRATVTGFPLKERERAATESRITIDPAAFDFQALQRLGK